MTDHPRECRSQSLNAPQLWPDRRSAQTQLKLGRGLHPGGGRERWGVRADEEVNSAAHSRKPVSPYCDGVLKVDGWTNVAG
jgi:hypothetical protein